MSADKIQQALVLAHQEHGDPPPALMRTGGLPNLKRVVLTLHRKGLRRFVLVTGAAGDRIHSALDGDPALAGLDLTWVDAHEATTDGAAVLAAREHLEPSFLLALADRVFDPAIAEALHAAPADMTTLAVDGQAPDAAWTGLARGSVGLLDTLRRTGPDGGYPSLTGAFDLLQERGGMERMHLDGKFVHTLRDAASRRAANRSLIRSLRKPDVDGPIARYLNRYFSLFLTRLLMNTPVRPNHVTFFTLLVATASGLAAALANPDRVWLLSVGALGWQLASMLDGTDGELARLKFQTSRWGEWFDTIVDDTGRLMVFVGTGYGYSIVSGNPLWFYIMLATVTLQVAVTARAYRLLWQIGAGSHFALAWTDDREKKVEPTFWSRFWKKIGFMSRRDYYIFVFTMLVVCQIPMAAMILATTTSAIVFFHELAWPRQPRKREVVERVVVRDEPEPR